MVDLYLIPLTISLLFFVGGFFTESEKKGTLIKAFMFILSAGVMYLAVNMAEVPQVTSNYVYPAYQVITNSTSGGVPTNTVQTFQSLNVTQVDNPISSSTVYILNWMFIIYLVTCILFTFFAIITGGTTVKEG